MPEPDSNCTCGHVYDEHRVDSKGVHECEVDECDCVMFDADEDKEGDE